MQLLESIWQVLDLYRIAVPTPAAATDATPRTDFELVTRGGQNFHWGSAPGKERPGEPRAIDKVKGLKAWAEEHGSLEKWDGGEAHHVSELTDPRRWRS